MQHPTRERAACGAAARAPTAGRRGPSALSPGPGFKADLHRRLDADAHRAPERHVRELRVRANLRGKSGRLQVGTGSKRDHRL